MPLPRRVAGCVCCFVAVFICSHLVFFLFLSGVLVPLGGCCPARNRYPLVPVPLSRDVRRGDATRQRRTGRGEPPRPATAPAGRPTSRGCQLGRPQRLCGRAAGVTAASPRPLPARAASARQPGVPVARHHHHVPAAAGPPPRARRPPHQPPAHGQRTRRGRHGADGDQAATERRRRRPQRRGGHASGARRALPSRRCTRRTSRGWRSRQNRSRPVLAA